jgi:hypothetical protein
MQWGICTVRATCDEWLLVEARGSRFRVERREASRDPGNQSWREKESPDFTKGGDSRAKRRVSWSKGLMSSGPENRHPGLFYR